MLAETDASSGVEVTTVDREALSEAQGRNPVQETRAERSARLAEE